MHTHTATQSPAAAEDNIDLTTLQVVLRWCTQHGVAVVPRSSSVEHQARLLRVLCPVSVCRQVGFGIGQLPHARLAARQLVALEASSDRDTLPMRAAGQQHSVGRSNCCCLWAPFSLSLLTLSAPGREPGVAELHAEYVVVVVPSLSSICWMVEATFESQFGSCFCVEAQRDGRVLCSNSCRCPRLLSCREEYAY